MEAVMHWIVLDLEATCWADMNAPDRQETIEIGAVRLDLADEANSSGEFGEFIRPILESALSDFCSGLTGITQEQVDRADPFPVVFERFLNWAGPAPFHFVTWGAYDPVQLGNDCQRHRIELPGHLLEQHINLKKEFAKAFRVRRCGMKRALEIAGISPSGSHHRGLDDARNIMRLLKMMIGKDQFPTRA